MGSGNWLGTPPTPVIVESSDYLNYVAGGESSGDISNGAVTMADGTVNVVIGGYADSNATKNKVFINGGTVTEVRGGEAHSGNATGNEVTISGGTVDRVYGGYSAYGVATGNTVTLAGGYVALFVRGSHCDTAHYYCAPSDLTGNTLNVQGKVTVGKRVYGFEKLGFKLPSNIKAGDTLLTVGTEDAEFAPLKDFSFAIDGSPALKEHDTITLIAAGGTLTISGYPASVSAGGWKFALSDDGKNLIAEVTEAPASTHTVTATATDGGTISCMPPDTVADGGEVTCTATATKTGYTLEKLEISDGVATPVTCTTSPSCTAKLTGVKGKVTATATFKDSGGGGGLPDAATISSINGDSKAKELQSGKENEVAFKVTAGGAPFNGSGTLSIAKVTKSRALQKASFAGGGTSTPVTIAGGTFTVKMTPEDGEKSIDLELAVPGVKDPFKFSLGVAGGGGGGAVTGTASPVPTMSEIGLLLSGIALAGAAAPALRRRERKGRKQD